MANNYSNMEIYSAVNTKTGEAYNLIALRGFATNPEMRTSVSGQLILNVSVAINNRNKRLNSVLGTTFPEDADNICWVRVTFWGQLAERLQKFMNGRKSVLLDIFGALRTNTYTGRDNLEHTSVEVSGFSFWSCPTGGASAQNGGQNNGRNTAQSYSQTQSYAAPARSQAPASSFNNEAFSDFADDDGEELPF